MRLPTLRTGTLALAAAVGSTLLLAACGRGGDAEALAALENAVPELIDGELYVSTSGDGSCATDCPEPTISRGWLVDCADTAATVASVADELAATGFSNQSGTSFVASVDGVDMSVDVSTYVDALAGPAPTEEPYLSDPARLADRCALFVLAVAT